MSGKYLQHAPESFRDKREIVLKAVQQDGMAIQFASKRLQKDEEKEIKKLY